MTVTHHYTVRQTCAAIAQICGLESLQQARSPTRMGTVCKYRHLYTVILREVTKAPWQEIADSLGNRCHTSMLSLYYGNGKRDRFPREEIDAIKVQVLDKLSQTGDTFQHDLDALIRENETLKRYLCWYLKGVGLTPQQTALVWEVTGCKLED